MAWRASWFGSVDTALVHCTSSRYTLSPTTSFRNCGAQVGRRSSRMRVISASLPRALRCSHCTSSSTTGSVRPSSMSCSNSRPAGGAHSGCASLSINIVLITASASFGSSARTIFAVNRPASLDTFSAFSGCDSHSPARSGIPAARTFWVINSALRKFSPTKPLNDSPIWSFLFRTIAVCGIGSPSGLRNSAVTANQSAKPPIIPASAAARTNPTHVAVSPGCASAHRQEK